MSDYPNRNRRRRNRSRGPRPEGPRPSREGREAPPSGLQKFLSIISFGLLGKSGSKNRPRPQSTRPAPESAPRPQREPREAREPREGREPREPRQRREAPAPVNPADITTERLYVGNLSYDASEGDLFELFNGVGAVRNAEVVVNSRTQRSKGFAFVTMGTVDEARRAVSELNGKDFMGRPLQLSGAKPNTRGSDAPAGQEQEEPAATA